MQEMRTEQIKEAGKPDVIEDSEALGISEGLEVAPQENLEEEQKEIESLKEGLEETFPKKRQRIGSVTRIVGKENAVSHETVLRNKDKSFYQQSFRGDWIKDPERWGSLKEREKTDEELEIIRMVDSVTDQLLEKYGLEKFHIPPENVHLMKRSIGLRVYETLTRERQKGDFEQGSNAIQVVDSISKIVLAQIVLHEMIHFKSYNAAQRKDAPNALMDQYRVGLKTKSRDGEKTYFKALNEAVTEELAKRLLPQVIEHEIFEEEKKKTETLKKSPILKSLYGINEDTYYVGYTGSADFSYEDERDLLSHAIDQIWAKHRDAFETKEEVFEVFARAAMTGNLLPLGRLFKNTFGKDSFRSYAEYGTERE